MNDNVVISEVVAGMNVVLSKAEKHVPYGEIAFILENYIRTDEWQCRYIRGRCWYECRTKQGRKTRALWGNRMYKFIAVVSHEPKSL